MSRPVSPHRIATPALLLLVVLGIVASGCAGIASPRGWASPVEDGDLLLVANRDVLFIYDEQTREVRRLFPAKDANIDDVVALYGTPAVANGTAFVPTYDGVLYALDIENGLIRWDFKTGGSLIGDVTVAGDTVYFGSDDGKVYALDAAANGRKLWDFDTGEAVWSAPTPSGDTLYVTSLNGRLYALDILNGIERWSFRTGAGIASPPVVDGLVYIAGFDRRLRAIDPATHDEVWSQQIDNWFWTLPLLSGGVIYAGALDSTVYAFDALSGVRLWTFPTESPVRAAPAIAGGVLIIVDRDGHLYGLGLNDGVDMLGGFLNLGSDVLADPLVIDASEGERVVIVTTDGDLLRIDPTTLQQVGEKALER